MSLPSIAELRKQKYKVRVTYLRAYKFLENGKVKSNVFSRRTAEQTLEPIEIHHGMQNKGGGVVIELRTPNGHEIVGSSECHPQDVFCKKIGRNLALKNALMNLNK